MWVRTAPDRFSAPSAVDAWSLGLLDAADLDGDGDEELFVSTGGNTAQLGALLDWDGCALRAVRDPDHAYSDWQYLHDGWGFSCMPTGCYPSITCVTNDGTVEIIESDAHPSQDLVERVAADRDVPREDFRFGWSWRRLRLVDGELKILGSGQGVDHVTDGLPVPLIRGVACSSWPRGSEGCVESPMAVDTWAWWELEGGWLPPCEAPSATP